MSDPYDGITQDNLELFKSNTNTFNGNLAHLIDNGGNGGRAYLDSLCSFSNYSFSDVPGNLYYESFPFYSRAIKLISHEMGHSLGSPHTHACFWNDDNTAIDSCGPIAGFSEGCDNGPIPPNGGTTMSYCDMLQTGVNFSIGFHPQVEDFLINNVETKICLGNNCIDNNYEKETTFQINQPDLNNVDINITDSIFTSWDYRFYDISNGPTGAFTTTNSKDLNFNNISNNTYYRFELNTNCIASDGTNTYKYFQNKEFLSDAEWCNLFVFFTDTGGLIGSYQKNNEILKTFYPNSLNEKSTIQFLEFETFQQDQMFIYDGTSINAPVFDNGILSG